MNEKFIKAVRTPEEAAKKLRKFIEKKKPLDYVQQSRQKKERNGDKNPYSMFIDSAEVLGLSAAKFTAWLAAGGSQFLLTLARWLTMDNVFLRKMEKKFESINVTKNKDGKNKKLAVILKEYPTSSAYVLWLLSLVAVAGSGYLTAEIAPKAISNYKEKRLAKEAEKQAQGTYRAFLNKVQPIVPFLIADLIAKEGVHVDKKTGLHTPYFDSENIATIGFGSTKLKNGRRVTKDTRPITTEEAYELARWHLEEETFFILYCYDVALNNVNINSTAEALALSSMFYNTYSKIIEDKTDTNNQNRFAELRKLYNEYGYSVTDDLVREVFEKYPIRKPTSFGKLWVEGADKEQLADALGGFLRNGRGIYWRRWLEAGLLTGDIKPEMLLNCPTNGMYEFFCVMGQKKSSFFTGEAGNRKVNKNTYKIFEEWLKNPVNAKGESLKHWKKVSDYMPEDVVDFCQKGECKLNNKNFKQFVKTREEISNETYTMGYDEQYKKAINAYKEKDYKSAAKKFEQMLEDYPNNALLHNDLAATYNHLGRYEEAIIHTRKILHEIGDKSQYAAAQYNAGFAYEKLGDFDRALMNYNLSVENGNLNVRKDIERVKKLRSKQTIAFRNAAKNISDIDFVEEQILYNNVKKSGKMA